MQSCACALVLVHLCAVLCSAVRACLCGCVNVCICGVCVYVRVHVYV